MVTVRSILSGMKFLFSRGAYRWMIETKNEENFTWTEVFGIVFLGDCRREKHWEGNNDW